MSCGNKASEYGLSELEYKIICDQIARRKVMREKFLKARTDPCAHSKQSGYVFDPSIQQFHSMKDTMLERFQCNFRTIRFGVLCVIVPMLSYGALIWNQRENREWEIRCGRIKYKDRGFKLQ